MLAQIWGFQISSYKNVYTVYGLRGATPHPGTGADPSPRRKRQAYGTVDGDVVDSTLRWAARSRAIGIDVLQSLKLVSGQADSKLDCGSNKWRHCRTNMRNGILIKLLALDVKRWMLIRGGAGLGGAAESLQKSPIRWFFFGLPA